MNLNEIYRQRLVFVDTCACIQHEKGFQNFIRASIPCLEETGSKIQIAYKCIEELGKIQKDLKKGQAEREAAHHALQILVDLQGKNLLDVRGKKTDSFADSVMLQNLLRYITKCHLLLITQDRGLAADAELLNHLKSVKSRKNIIIRQLDNYGNLIEINGR